MVAPSDLANQPIVQMTVNGVHGYWVAFAATETGQKFNETVAPYVQQIIEKTPEYWGQAPSTNAIYNSMPNVVQAGVDQAYNHPYVSGTVGLASLYFMTNKLCNENNGFFTRTAGKTMWYTAVGAGLLAINAAMG